MASASSFFLALGLLILSSSFISSLARTAPALYPPPTKKVCRWVCEEIHEDISPPPPQNMCPEPSSPPTLVKKNEHEATSPPTPAKKNKYEAISPPPHKSYETTSPPIPTKNTPPPTPVNKNKDKAISPPAPTRNTSPPTPAKKNEHKAISPPPQESHEATSPPAPTKNTSPPTPAKKNKHKAVSPPPPPQESHEATSPPAPTKNTSPPTPAKKNKHKAVSPPPPPQESHEATSPPAPTKNTSPPTPTKKNKHKAISPPPYENHEATSPPAPTKNTLPPTPAKNKSHEATSPPAHKSHETTSPPVPAQNISPPTPAPNKGHETNSPPAPTQNTSPPMPIQDKGHNTNSPPAQSKSHEVTSPPTQNYNHGNSTSSSFYKGAFSYVFAFGESNTDRGNAFRLESHASATSNHNQFCDGRLVIDFLCDALALPTLPLYKASTSANFTFGVNFAIAGSTSLPSSYLGKSKNSISLWNGIPAEGVRTQIDWFNNFKIQMGYKDEYSFKAKMADALFWIGGMGFDDYTRVHGLAISAQWLAKNSVASVATILHAVLNNGAKYIVVQGLPPVGCLPLTITSCPLRLRDHMGCAPLANAAIKLHNQILQAELKTFRALHPQATIVYADYWNAYLTILANPAKYNIEEPFKACCGAGGDLNFKIQSICGSPGTSKCKDPSKYINWDGVHLTQAMHKQITNLLINGNFCQPSFAEMIKHKRGT